MINRTMITGRIWISLIIIFFFSILGLCFWLYEIVEIKTLFGLTWLSEPLYSPFLAALFSVFAFMTPFFVNKQLTIKKALVSIIILYTINIICFQIGKQLCFEMYSRFSWFSETTSTTLLIPVKGLFLFIFLSFAYWLTTHKLIKENKKINMVFITALLLLTIPLSLLTIQINSGFGSGTGWVDAVKMGYPVFWITMLLGLSGLMITRQPFLNKRDL